MKYYVYIYQCPETMLPFYIGKGCGKRAWSHLWTAIHGKRKTNQRLYEHIALLIQAGSPPHIHIHSRYETSQEAVAVESSLIEEYGFIDQGGSLLNLMGRSNAYGGCGYKKSVRKSPSTKGRPGVKWSREKRNNHSIIMKEIMNDEAVVDRCRRAKLDKGGHPHTIESKTKIGNAHRGRKSPEKSRSKMGNLNPMFGSKWFNDGVSQKMFKPGTEPPGWKLGKIRG